MEQFNKNCSHSIQTDIKCGLCKMVDAVSLVSKVICGAHKKEVLKGLTLNCAPDAKWHSLHFVYI